jgi:hypothetical protein
VDARAPQRRLAPIYAPLATTRLSGKLDVDLGADGNGFAAMSRTARCAVELRWISARSSPTNPSSSSGFALAPERRARRSRSSGPGCGAQVRARRNGVAVRPRRYSALPAGIDGRIVAKGTSRLPGGCRPTLRLPKEVDWRASRSRTARGTLTRESIRDAAIDLSAGRARLTATGSADTQRRR